MEFSGKVAVVTGAARGLGQALAARFAAEGCRVVLADTDEAGVLEAAAPLGGLGIRADLSSRAEVDRVIDEVIAEFGGVDLWFSNAAYSGAQDLLATTDDKWQLGWDLNVRSHVWAAQRLFPGWLERGEGCLAQTVSAIALTLNHWDPIYAATKRAALALNEYLAVNYGNRGIQIACFCPRGMRTDRLMKSVTAGSKAGINALATAVTPEEAADIAVRGIIEGRFLTMTETDELESHRAKAADYDAWIASRTEQFESEAADRG